MADFSLIDLPREEQTRMRENPLYAAKETWNNPMKGLQAFTNGLSFDPWGRPSALEQLRDSKAERYRTPLDPDQEEMFQQWYRQYAGKNSLDPNPDDHRHQYDYRGYWSANQREPDKYFPQRDENDGFMHLPSQFKDQDHPTRFQRKDGVTYDSISGQIVNQRNR